MVNFEEYKQKIKDLNAILLEAGHSLWPRQVKNWVEWKIRVVSKAWNLFGFRCVGKNK